VEVAAVHHRTITLISILRLVVVEDNRSTTTTVPVPCQGLLNHKPWLSIWQRRAIKARTVSPITHRPVRHLGSNNSNNILKIIIRRWPVRKRSALGQLQDLVNNNKLLQPFIRSDRPVVIHLMGISSNNNSNNNRVTTLDNFYNLLLHQDRCLTVTNFHQRLLIHRLNNNNKILHDVELQAVLSLLSPVSPQQRLRLQQQQLLLPLFLLHLPRLLLDRLANVVLQHRRVQDQQLLEEQVAALQRLHHLPRPPVAEPIRIQVRHQVQAMLPSLPASSPAVMQAFKIGAMSTCRVFLATRKPIHFLRRLPTHVIILTAATTEIPG
jgi:hypothetical protein